jgi:DNA-dependent RNA polymerase auxiliary subunit epsilon
LLHDLEELDSLYIKANKELQKRGILKDGWYNFKGRKS